MFIALVDQITAATTLPVAEAHIVWVSFGISGAAPALHAGGTEALATVLLANLGAQPEGYLSRDFVHLSLSAAGCLNPARARHG